MARAPGPQIEVICYHCGTVIETSARTKSTSCPGCHKPVLVEDIVIKSYIGLTNIETCGRLIVQRRGCAVAQNRIVAHGGIEVKGRVQCVQALTAGQTLLTKQAEWTGNLNAQSLIVEQGAVINSGHFKVPEMSFQEERPQPRRRERGFEQYG
jgi:hypothetical protein